MAERTSIIKSIVSIVIFYMIIVTSFYASADANTLASKERSVDDFGNPRTDVNACGRNGSKSYICDPDQVLTFDQDNLLDTMIEGIRTSTPCPCSSAICGSTGAGYLVTVAMLNKIKLNASQENADSRTKEDARALQLNTVLNGAKNLAHELQKKWNLGRCGESVLVLFSRQDNVLYSVAEPAAGRKLTSDLIGEIAMDVRSDFGQNIFKGFEKLLTEYRAVFNDSYKRKTKWEALNMPDANPVIGASSNLLHIYVYFYTLVTVIITCLLQL